MFNIKSLPKNETINYIIHLSDIHIRSGNLEKSRYEQYIYTFNNLFEKIALYPRDILDETVIIITGDIFHVKNNADSTGIHLFNYLIDGLSDFCPLYLIQGNHDFKQDCPDEPDILSSLFYKNPRKNIEYLAETGLYITKNITFGLVSVKDTLIKNSAVGKLNNRELPNFPVPCGPINSAINIALFHGTIHEDFAYSISWFYEYDICLLGDIHLQQLHNINEEGHFKLENKPWGYSGSLIQQSFGEKIIKHGFLFWDLLNKKVSSIDVKTNIGLINLNDDLIVLNTDKKLSIFELLEEDNCPDMIKIRIPYNMPEENLNKLMTYSSPYKKFIIEKGITKIMTKQISETIEEPPLNDMNTIDKWIDYIKSNENSVLMTDSNWPTDMKNLNNFLLPLCNNSIDDKIIQRNKTLIKIIEKLQNKMAEDNTNKKYFNIIKIEWDWLFCYKNANIIDLSKEPNDINLIYNINGNNSAGKSSIFDIICITIFGKQIPSRQDKSLINIINCQKPPDKTAMASIQIKIAENIYKIQRQFMNKNGFKSEVTIYLNDKELKKGSTAANSWIDDNIGKIDNFLLSNMISQKCDKDFLTLDTKAQIELFDVALNMDSITIFKSLLIELINSYDFILKIAESQYSLLNAGACVGSGILLDDYADEIGDYKSKLKMATCLPTNNDPNYFNLTYEQICAKCSDVNIIEMNKINGFQLETIEWDEKYEEELTYLNSFNYTFANTYIKELINGGVRPPTKTKPNGFIDKYFQTDYVKNKLVKYTKIIDEWCDLYNEYKGTIDIILDEEPQINLNELKRLEPQCDKLKIISEMELEDLYSGIFNTKDNIIEYKKLIKIIKYKNKINDKINNYMNAATDIAKEISILNKELSDLKHLPYNKDCEACNAQPWKIREKSLNNKYSELMIEKTDYLYKSNYNKCLLELIKAPNLDLNKLLAKLKKMKNGNGNGNGNHENLYKEAKLKNYFALQYKYNISKIKYKRYIEYTKIKDIYIKYYNKCALYNIYYDYIKYINVTNYKRLIILNNSKYMWYKSLKYYANLRDTYEDFHKYNLYKTKLADLETKAAVNKQLNIINKTNYELHNIYKDYINKLNKKAEIIGAINSIFIDYRNWLYKNIIIPKITNDINKLVYNILDADCILQIELDINGGLLWYIIERGNKSSIKTAGGFREFIYSLAIRIILNNIGCSTMKCGNLFIDEGFVSGSSENLQKIPEFIKSLTKYYKAIFIVSHLDIIKNASDIYIPIEKDKHVLSNIKYIGGLGGHRDKISDKINDGGENKIAQKITQKIKLKKNS